MCQSSGLKCVGTLSLPNERGVVGSMTDFTDRALAREEICDFVAGQRFELEQALREHFEVGAFLVSI